MPYPSLASNKIKKRMSDNPNYYGYKTITDLIQSTGRSVRSFDDYANTYILDSCFGDILRYSYKYIPDWFMESIKVLK